MTEQTITISEKDFLGQGGTKRVYRHPDNPQLCIKFPRKDKPRALNGLLRELKYLKKYQEKLPFLSPYLGKIQSNLGTGYLYQIAQNEDGTPAKDLRQHHQHLDSETLYQKISHLYQLLVKERAVVNDLQLSNFFIIEKSGKDYDLCLVDGFGNTNLIKICDYSKYFLLKKLNRKFKKLCSKLKLPSDFLDHS